MSTPSAIARSAPIAIASRKPPPETNGTNGRDKNFSNSMSSTTSAESGSNIRTRKDRPCDACRRRKSRCVIHEGQQSCVLCQFHTQDCTFVQSPQPRKRKLNTEGKEESSAKRRHVQISSKSLASHPALCRILRGVTTNMIYFLDPQIDRMIDMGGQPSQAYQAMGLRAR